MNISEIKKQLQTLKIHLDQVDNWVKQGMDMVYDIEQEILDIEESNAEIGNPLIEAAQTSLLKEAASGVNMFLHNPPRLSTDRCGTNHIAAAKTFQEEFLLTL